MKLQIVGKVQVAALSALWCALSYAYVDDGTKVVIGTRETMTAEISSATTWDKPVVVCGVLRKIGPGKLTIVGEKLYGAGRIDVAEGELEITATGAGSAEFAEPMSVMSGAAMWLDASMHVADSTGAASSGDAVAWYDVRETDWATPGFTTNYIYAQAYNNLATGGLWPQIGTDDASRPYVDFGGTSSGQYMTWLTPSGAKAWIPVIHSFVAYSPNGKHGHVIGTATSPAEDSSKVMYFATSGGASGTTLFIFSPDYNLYRLRLGRVFRDGVQADPAAEIDLNATQLIETDGYDPAAKAEAFFNFRNYQQSAGSGTAGNRVGGGRLHEVLIFTNALSETDRILVEQRLLRKWVKQSGYTIPPEITVASGATLALAKDLAPATTVRSEGTIRCPGAAVSTHSSGIDPFAVSGKVAFDNGATVSNRALMAVAPQSGKTYSVDAWNTMTVADGAADETEKAGAGSVAFAGFGDAQKLTVSQGFASVHTNATDVLREVSANCIADGGFEGIWSGTTWNAYNNGTAIGAWTVTNYYGSASTRITYKTGWAPMWNGGTIDNAIPIPDGDYYLLFKQGGGARQAFTTYKGGRYRITLRCYPRSSDLGNAAFARVYIDGYSVGTVQCRPKEGDWDAACLVTPYVEPGEHVLALMSELEVDNAIGIDDVRVVLLDEERDTPALANGNFEDIDWVVAPSQPGADSAAKNAISYAIHGYKETDRILSTAYLKGWTATGPAYLLRRLPYLRSSNEFIGPDNDNGCVSMVISNATVLSQSVTVPATGVYRLHAKAARYQHGTMQRYIGQPTHYYNGKMSLAVGESSEEFTIPGWSLTDFAMTDVVLLHAGDVVTVSVTSTDTAGYVNVIAVDDVRLVRETGNLVRNGGFEDGADSSTPPPGWTSVANPANKQLRYNGTSGLVAAAPEGAARCRLHNGTHISQTIPLSAGYYRLSFWDAPRSDAGRPAYGPVPLIVTLASGSTTNFCETVTPSTNCVDFMRREYLVKVETAGSYTLGFEAETVWQDADPTQRKDISSYIDAVSLRPALDVVADAVPETSSGMMVSVRDGAELQLDYDGEAKVGRLRVAAGALLRGLGRLCATIQSGIMILVR